jgi:hypothetical protein
MRTSLIPVAIASLMFNTVLAQGKFKGIDNDSIVQNIDTMITVQLKDVNVFTFKNPDDQMEFYKNRTRILKVLPYVKIAMQLYDDLQVKKDNQKKREYRHYRKDLEKDMREKFEKELKNLNVGQGKVLVKLINRETGNNCYEIIKDVKGGFNAFTWQVVARHYDYNLKEQYNKDKEWILEMAIKSLGAQYDIKPKLVEAK